MATKRNGEKYLGQELHVPLSQDGQVTAYVWPIRALNVRGSWCGGPTIGVDVGNEEIIRFDCHDRPGHWARRRLRPLRLARRVPPRLPQGHHRRG